jgi:hypothetical protein
MYYIVLVNIYHLYMMIKGSEVDKMTQQKDS